MDDSLVFRLVYDTCIKKKYKDNTKKYADELNNIIRKIRMSEKETHLCGMMEVISYISEVILKEFGYSTKWYLKRVPSYYPLKVQALNLFTNERCEIVNSNPLGGYRV
jgi:hypothetical protein